MKPILLVLFFCFAFPLSGYPQATGGEAKQESVIQNIFSTALTEGKSYGFLAAFSSQTGSRYPGSVGLNLAEQFIKTALDSLAPSKVYTEPVYVPKWTRGAPEFAYFESAPEKKTPVAVCAWAGSVGTPATGIKARLVKLNNVDDLYNLDPSALVGKIIFINEPLDPSNIDQEVSYDALLEKIQRAIRFACLKGAAGAVVRALTTAPDETPHTAYIDYETLPYKQRIPVVSISVYSALLLSSIASLNPETLFYFSQTCKTLPPQENRTIISEFKGRLYPEEIITVRAPLDSWDLGAGAHSSGSACAQSIEAIRLLRSVGYTPKRTIRLVFFVGKGYGLSAAKAPKETPSGKTILTVENHQGGFAPIGFAVSGAGDLFEKKKKQLAALQPYNIFKVIQAEPSNDATSRQDGAKGLSVSLLTDNQKYYDYAASEKDLLPAVNKRELSLGAAALASLLFLTDSAGF